MNTERSLKSPHLAMARCLWMTLLLPLGGHAQAGGVFVDIGPCMSTSPDAARYACYDALEASIRQAQQKQPEAAVSSVVEEKVVEEEAENAIADFGKAAPSAAVSARLEEDGEGAQVLYDKVRSLREREPDQWLITLESGQVWYQTNSQHFRLSEGKEVRIYPSPLGGSWRLSISGVNGFIQVRRVE